MKLRIIAFGLLSAFCFAATAQEAGEVTIEGTLVLAKTAGLCITLDEMISFQKELQFADGNDFVTRFWMVTAAKWGMGIEEFSDYCNRVMTSYQRVFDAALQESRGGQ